MTVAEEEASYVLTLLRSDAEKSYEHYLELLNEDARGKRRSPQRLGLARELARMNLSVNFYTQWYWKIDLHNFMRFLLLRSDVHAQYEIRSYAESLIEILQRWVPITAEAFHEHQLGSVQLSATAVRVISQMLEGKEIDAMNSGLTKREWDELVKTFGIC